MKDGVNFFIREFLAVFYIPSALVVLIENF